ncbi:hypothetical protein BN1326_110008 [Staphylococcus argenteus]|uniref:Uncharacterized protein n=1 Tax=Staphylococcus argenteus TaxID=985002 RepID=A0A7U7JQN1_9STAP|nr:hypothetical protein BN1326_110008 [Staphylococcus argenteus]CRI11914.1 hypothetical protein BN1326_110008 [Staphylococcus argenteus]
MINVFISKNISFHEHSNSYNYYKVIVFYINILFISEKYI